MAIRPAKKYEVISSKKKPFQPAIGPDYEVNTARLIEAKTRDFIAKLAVVVIVVAVAITGLCGLWTGDFRNLIAVWAVAGPITGAIIAYFFGMHRKDTG